MSVFLVIPPGLCSQTFVKFYYDVICGFSDSYVNLWFNGYELILKMMEQ